MARMPSRHQARENPHTFSDAGFYFFMAFGGVAFVADKVVSAFFDDDS